ncbi:MAG: GspH/FimT family pseudopilin [Sedimenticola sp.]|nr:GspH/FimT family pseudopilin [Sedimenticola sp.]
MQYQVNTGRHRCAGLTLLELVTTLAISGIMLSLAVPAMSALSGNNARVSATNTLVRHLQLARSEAVTRGRVTILCPSPGGRSCSDSTSWEQGYILVLDSNNNRSADSGDTLVRVFQGLDERIAISSTAGRKRILFNPLGMSPGYNLTLSFCDRQQVVEPRAVILSNTGRPRLSETRPDGSPIQCS